VSDCDFPVLNEGNIQFAGFYYLYSKSKAMHIVKVTYTVKAEYAQKNQENIGSVMNDLRKINHAGIRYGTYLGEDGKTFMHFASFEQKEFQQILFDLEAFKTFTQELRESGPEVPPKTEVMQLVGSSYEIFI